MKGDIAHLCNRGVNKQKIFNNGYDYLRFIECLYKLNNRKGALQNRHFDLAQNDTAREKLVEILKWSLLPNHYHLLLVEAIDGGIVEFAKRLGNSYTKYFNIKNKRIGYLFEKKANIIIGHEDSYLQYLPYYVEINPLDLYDQSWRNGEIKNANRAIDFLERYEWSSYRNYAGKKNFTAVINIDLFFKLFDSDQLKYRKEVKRMISSEMLLTNKWAELEY